MAIYWPTPDFKGRTFKLCVLTRWDFNFCVRSSPLRGIGKISILQSTHKQGNPSFHFHAPGSKRRYPCTQAASAVPKYFPCLLQFCTGYRIWHASIVWKRKTLIYTQLKISGYNQHFFAVFRRILIKWPPTYLLLSDLFIHFHIFSWQQ